MIRQDVVHGDDSMTDTPEGEDHVQKASDLHQDSQELTILDTEGHEKEDLMDNLSMQSKDSDMV